MRGPGSVSGGWIGLAVVVVLVIAGAWAVFPSLIGGAPDALAPEPVAIGDIVCTDCPYFDLDAAGITPTNGTYPATEADPILSGDSGSDLRWGVNQGSLTLDFSVGNDTDSAQILIRGLALEVREYSELPDQTRMACVPSSRGELGAQGVVDGTEFSLGIDPDSGAATRSIPIETGNGMGIELGPSELRAYRGEISVARPGVYTLAVSVDYETPSGESGSLSSNPIDIILMDAETTVIAFPPSDDPVCQGAVSPRIEMPALLTDVSPNSDETPAVEFAFADNLPGYTIALVEAPITEKPSGRQIEIDGEKLVEITMSPAASVDLSGSSPRETYSGPDRLDPGIPGITEAVLSEDHGGIMTWVLGLERGYWFGFSSTGNPAAIRIEPIEFAPE